MAGRPGPDGTRGGKVRMGTGQPLQVGSDVAGLLSGADLDLLARSASTGYQCVACGRSGGPAAGPAAVIVLLSAAPGPAGPQVAHVRLAHGRCAPSQVISDAASLAAPPEATMSLTAGVVPHGDGLRVLLIAEPSVHLSLVTAADGERVDTALAALLGQGLHLLASAGEPAPRAPGWLVSLPSPAEAVISDPSGDLFYAGELQQPREWRRLTASRGEVELLTGAAGIGADGPAQTLAALADAARGGRLAGATVAVRRR